MKKRIHTLRILNVVTWTKGLFRGFTKDDSFGHVNHKEYLPNVRAFSALSPAHLCNWRVTAMQGAHAHLRGIASFFCLLTLLLLTGCPYESGAPLGPAGDAKIDAGLLGRWKYEDKESREVGFLTISRFNDTELLIAVEEEGRKVPEMMRAFTTNVGGEKFLNVQEIKGPYGERGWMFARYKTGDCSISYSVVNDSLAPEGGQKNKGLTGGQLVDLIRKSLGNKKVFDEETTLACVRK